MHASGSTNRSCEIVCPYGGGECNHYEGKRVFKPLHFRRLTLPKYTLQPRQEKRKATAKEKLSRIVENLFEIGLAIVVVVFAIVLSQTFYDEMTAGL